MASIVLTLMAGACFALSPVASQAQAACKATGFWSGYYLGQTTDKDGNPKKVAGDFTATISQSGTTTSSVVYAAGFAVPVPGSNVKGKLSFGPVSVENTTDTASGSFVSKSCTTVLGSFLVERNRPISGQFRMSKPTQIPPKYYFKTPSSVVMGVRG